MMLQHQTAPPTSPARSSIQKPAQKQKSFGSFLQKRTESSFSEEKVAKRLLFLAFCPFSAFA
jgi:hypothetical protein